VLGHGQVVCVCCGIRGCELTVRGLPVCGKRARITPMSQIPPSLPLVSPERHTNTETQTCGLTLQYILTLPLSLSLVSLCESLVVNDG